MHDLDDERPRPLKVLSGMPAAVRRVLVTVMGVTLIVAGAVAVVLPGPWTIPPILAGLALLATEYMWARRWQRRMHSRVRQVKDAVTTRTRRGGR
ncbi:PGPGW domain-containing protein [Planosporangium sp. 12N6]|uniref:PGPGW domain-containing protein n=1 Tax=Planosporangium spinosum TaxID=3402278 RepID=UPI003CEF17F3